MLKIASALIVGGGLGGLSAAVALAKAGVRTVLIERNQEVTALGAGLTFNGATARVMQSLGVLDAVIAAGCVHGSSDVYDSQGQLRAASSNEEVYGPGVPILGGILRPVIHQIMIAAARAAGAEIRTGLCVDRWEQDEAGVTAEFSDGSRERFDLAVGADGIMSTTRAQLFPQAPKPVFTGQGCWRAVIPRPPEVKTSALFVGEHKKVGVNPVSKEEMYLFVMVRAAGNPRFDEAQGLPVLQQLLEGYGGLIGRVRDGLNPDSRIVYRPLETLVMPAPWHVGRVVLIGDAVHATTPHVGYGAGLAMEDGVILGEMVRAGIAADAIGECFTMRRYERCAAVVEGSVELGEMEMRNAPVAEWNALFQSVYAKIREPA